ncbi:MAG: O-antigen ligase family protein [Rhodospirillaceae bacterium]|nr:O-antigen ligase family protein [Rhodospirillaceae bacterium]
MAAKIVFWGMLVLLAWAPLPFASNRPWSWSLLSLVIGALLIVWSLAALRQPALMRLSWRRCTGAMILFLLAALWAFFQTLAVAPEALHAPLWQQASRLLDRPLTGSLSADPAAGRDGLMRLAAYGGMFWLAAQFGREPAYARRILCCVAVVGTLYALYGIFVYSTGNKWILWYERWAYGGDLTSTFVSRSAFGAFAGMALLSALALLLRPGNQNAGSRQSWRGAITTYLDSLPPAFYGLVMACLILATALMLSHSRGAVAVTAMGLAVMLAGLVLRTRNRRRYWLFALCIIVATGAAITEFSGRITLGRALQLADHGTGREAIHDLTQRGIDDAPVTGRGLGSFPQLYFQYRDLTIPWGSPRYDKAHSTYLELILELGYVGFGLLMAALCLIILRLFTGVLRRRRNAVYPAWGLGMTALVATHAILDFSIQIPAIAMTYAAILGVAFAQSWPTDQPGSV